VSELERCLSDFEAGMKAQQGEASPASPIEGKVCLGIERALMARFLDADLGRYYGGRAEDQIVFQLRAQLFAKSHLPGNSRNMGMSVAPDFGVALPATVLGVPWMPRRDQEPWASGEPPIRCAADLEGRPLPDMEYVRFLGGQAGYHSCGNTTPLMDVIASMGQWSYMHVSAWSDLDKALRCFPTTHLIVCLHPYREALGCPLQAAKDRIREILAKCRGRSFTLAITELMPVNGPEKDLQRIRDLWSFCEDAWSK
jgi:hypothetical protein